MQGMTSTTSRNISLREYFFIRLPPLGGVHVPGKLQKDASCLRKDESHSCACSPAHHHPACTVAPPHPGGSCGKYSSFSGRSPLLALVCHRSAKRLSGQARVSPWRQHDCLCWLSWPLKAWHWLPAYAFWLPQAFRRNGQD